jgi:hypothetical protein
VRLGQARVGVDPAEQPPPCRGRELCPGEQSSCDGVLTSEDPATEGGGTGGRGHRGSLSKSARWPLPSSTGFLSAGKCAFRPPLEGCTTPRSAGPDPGSGKTAACDAVTSANAGPGVGRCRKN